MSAFEQRFTFPENGWLVLQSLGDVLIQGVKQPDVLLRIPEEGMAQVQSQTDRLFISAQSDVEIFVPEQAKIRLEGVTGDASVVGVLGYMEIARVNGDLAMRSCDKVDIGVVNGDVELLQVAGPIVLRRAGGDLFVESRNRVVAEQVGGDATIRADGLVRAKAGGDLNIQLISVNVEEVHARCGGDLLITAPSGLGAQLDVNSGGFSITLRLPDQTLNLDQPHYSTTLGNGKTLLRLVAGGDVSVQLGDSILQEQKVPRKSFTADFVGGIEIPDLSPFVEDKIRHKMEHATRKGEERARRAEERVRRAMERVEQAQRQVHRRNRWFGFWYEAGKNPEDPAVPKPPEVPKAPEAPETFDTSFSQVTNEERLLVLKMLQEHKITVEEAEQLLAVLDGDLDVE